MARVRPRPAVPVFVRFETPPGDEGQAEMRWAWTQERPGRHFEPVGLWIHQDWAAIRQELEARLAYARLAVLGSDRGPGIEESLRHPGMQHQRCRWHGKRSFPYLLYADGFKRPAQGPLLQQLQAIPVLTASQAQLERLRPEDRPVVEQLIAQNEEGFRQLLAVLDPGRYPKARSYIEHLLESVTTALPWWLQHGEAIPTTTSAIESTFSQVSNRIKRVGKRWSGHGLLNRLRITFYKICKPELSARIWLLSLQTSYAWSGAIT